MSINLTFPKKLQNETETLCNDAAKGAFTRSRARWLENGERNYFLNNLSVNDSKQCEEHQRIYLTILEHFKNNCDKAISNGEFNWSLETYKNR